MASPNARVQPAAKAAAWHTASAFWIVCWSAELSGGCSDPLVAATACACRDSTAPRSERIGATAFSIASAAARTASGVAR